MPSVILRDTKLQGNIIEKDSITIDGIMEKALGIVTHQ